MGKKNKGSFNPVDAHRRKIKKQQQLKNKKKRLEARDEALSKRDPSWLMNEINKINRQERIIEKQGKKPNEKLSNSKKKLLHYYDLAVKKFPNWKEKLNEKNDEKYASAVYNLYSGRNDGYNNDNNNINDIHNNYNKSSNTNNNNNSSNSNSNSNSYSSRTTSSSHYEKDRIKQKSKTKNRSKNKSTKFKTDDEYEYERDNSHDTNMDNFDSVFNDNGMYCIVFCCV